MDVRTELLRYFELEKNWCIGLALFGAVVCALALTLWFGKGPYRAAAIPIGLLAVFELSIGTGVAVRTDKQVAELSQRLDAKQDMAMERTRMERVTRTFEIAKLVWLVAFAVGVALTYGLRSSDFGFALGIGLIAQTAGLLIFDLIAERRAEVYLRALRAFSSGA